MCKKGGPMSLFKNKWFVIVGLLLACSMTAYGYDPAKGAVFLPSIYAPWSLSGQATVTGGSAPWASLMNPSALAGSELYQIEVDYTGITDFGAGTQGWGSAANIAFACPVSYGVWGTSLQLLSVPSTMTSMPLGTVGTFNASFAKDLLPNLYLGSALHVSLGSNAGSSGWGLGADVGMTHLLGDVGILKDARWGIALLNMGKGYVTTPSPSGILGGAASAYPSTFTLGLGIRGYLIQSYDWNLDTAFDLWTPGFADLNGSVSVGLDYRQLVSLRLGWSAGYQDINANSGRSLYPSVGLSGRIPLGRGSTAQGKQNSGAVLSPSVAVAPLYDSLYAASAGVKVSYGTEDKTPPVITVKLPVPFRGVAYISPNGDGRQDYLEIPVSISDERYVTGWQLKIEDKSSGKIVKTLGQSHDKPEKITSLKALGEALTYSLKNVEVPASIIWDGKDDSGNIVPDGPYTVSLIAWDDNGNINLDYQSCMTVVVDNRPPQGVARVMESSMIFSPDSDNSKDTFAFRNTGSVENDWQIVIRNSDGVAVRTQDYKERSAPRDFTWDGTADDGARVPDGLYSASLVSKDEAGNVTESKVSGITVDTSRPEVAIATDSPVMSPNNDGIKDTLRIQPSLQSTKGLESWRIFVLDPDRKEVWAVSGNGENPPEKSYLFAGFDSEGAALPDGAYEAGIDLSYDNGYKPQKLSDSFYMDRTPPEASIRLGDAARVFSPDGDGRKDSYTFLFSSSEEDTWNMIIRDRNKSEVLVQKFNQKLPAAFEWNGKDGQGKTVADGDYEVYVFAVDRAGNSFATTSSTVKVDTRKPAVSLSADRDAFSPNGDGIAESVSIKPSIETKDGIVAWKFAVLRADSGEVWTASGTGAPPPPDVFIFSGQDNAGAALPEGRYVADMKLSWINGYETEATSGVLTLDRTFPAAKAEADKHIFNPLGRDDQKTVAITQNGSPEDLWKAQIFDASGTAVKTWDFKGVPQSIRWDGRNDAGFVAPDGTYFYVVKSTDASGNAFSTEKISLAIDTQKKDAGLSADMPAFSPNGDGTKDMLSLSASATAPDKVLSWELQIGAYGKAGQQPVKTWRGTAPLQQKFEWNGTSDSGLEVPDGLYGASLSLSYPNGDQAAASFGPILIDRIVPRAEVAASVDLFSPNGDGVLDTVTFRQVPATSGDEWQGTLSTTRGDVLRRWTWSDALASLVWDGKDETNALVPDGTYYYELTSVDKAGNSYSSGKIAISVETEKKTARLDVDQRAFSPNGDGLKDELSLLAKVQAQERVKQYQVQIFAQEGPGAMQAVRTWKGTGTVPEKFVWKGETDAGLPAPDGRYAAAMTVDYFNGDEVESQTPAILVDRIFPKIEISADLAIISPNGDGRSDNVTIRQKSEPGDDWTGTISAADGRQVRVYRWKGNAADFVWDGKDGNGTLVKDGDYQYSAESTDGAGNRTKSRSVLIAVETEKKTVRFDADMLAFSPNGDGKRDTVRFGVKAQYPERVKHYELALYPAGTDGTSLPVKSWKGESDIATSYEWNGIGDSGLQVPDGVYRAVLKVEYKNDDLFLEEIQRITVDRVAPSASASADRDVISPNGDGRADTVAITQDSVPGDTWKGQIVSSSNKVVRTWTWQDRVSPIVWDGKDQTGTVVADGIYTYTLSSVDVADNAFAITPIRLQVDAAKKDVRLSVDQKAFSPNGDGVKDALHINLKAPKAETLKQYELDIFALDAKGGRQNAPVRSWKGDVDIKEQYEWAGKTDSGIAVPDGTYQASLSLDYVNGDNFQILSGPVVLDTVAPKITVSSEYLLFSPNGDGIKDTIVIHQESEPGDDWTGRIKNAAGATIRSWTWKGAAKDFSWDGKDSSGSLKDGQFSYEVTSTDDAGNKGYAALAGIRIDATKPRVYVTASDTGISPNGDGVRDEVSFGIVVENRDGVESWRFSLKDKKGVERSFFSGVGSDVPARLVWDGHDMQGQVVQDEYVGVLEVRYAKGDIATASSAPIIVGIDPPKADISVSPEYFSPDGDGVDDQLTFGIKTDNAASIVDWKLSVMETAIVESTSPESPSAERLFMEWSGKGKPPEKILWNGKSSTGELVESATDYPFTFVAHDVLGNATTVSGIVAVDVLVMRDGDRLKIKVPSIVFRANHADFEGLPREITDRNERVIARIAQILNKFPDYRIRIEGHANNIGKMLGYSQAKIQAEETKELIPLSAGRAELVKSMLIKHGVDARRLSVQGLGSSEPVVSFTDVENRWKNRRVEFILIKNQ